MKPLHKTTVVIWSDYDPTHTMELSELAREAESGNAYCSRFRAVLVKDPTHDSDWDDTEFFGDGTEDPVLLKDGSEWRKLEDTLFDDHGCDECGIEDSAFANEANEQLCESGMKTRIETIGLNNEVDRDGL